MCDDVSSNGVAHYITYFYLNHFILPILFHLIPLVREMLLSLPANRKYTGCYQSVLSYYILQDRAFEQKRRNNKGFENDCMESWERMLLLMRSKGRHNPVRRTNRSHQKNPLPIRGKIPRSIVEIL